MKLPHAENAVVDIRKLRVYCLDPEHADGKHKARLFAAAFGMTTKEAPELREILLQIVKPQEATLGRRDGYGQRYLIDFVMEWRGKRALVRSGWIIEHSSDTPRLTTCYPL